MVVKETRSKATILLVEDDGEVRKHMRRFLEDLGYAVALATDEADALRLVGGGQTQIQLILLDLTMLSECALAAGRRIREHINGSNRIPVVVLPFEFTKELEGTDQNIGADDYKSYMATEQQLEDLLGGLLSNRSDPSAFRMIRSAAHSG